MAYGLTATEGSVVVVIHQYSGRVKNSTRTAQTILSPKEAKQMAKELKRWAEVADKQLPRRA